MGNKIKVLVVDDSAIVRESLKSVLDTSPDIEVVGVAGDPIIAFNKLDSLNPDVIISDIEMPRMDGITFLKELKARGKNIPVVVCSSLVEKGSDKFMESLSNGAVEVILKPRLGSRYFFEEAKITICDAVKSAYLTRDKHKQYETVVLDKKDEEVKVQLKKEFSEKVFNKILVLGSSTGGIQAIELFLSMLPSNCPPIVIVQHMPEGFTAQLANRLNGIYAMDVKEAEDNDVIRAGRVLIAPGNKHALVKEDKNGIYRVEIKDGPLVSRHRPSVDVLFRSAALRLGNKAVGVILTGMGNDGSIGMKEMREAGAYNIAQNKESCIVFGMPAEAIKAGAINITLPLKEIAKEVLRIM